MGVAHNVFHAKVARVAARVHVFFPTHCFATYATTAAVGAWHANGARVALHMVAKFVRFPNVALVT